MRESDAFSPAAETLENLDELSLASSLTDESRAIEISDIASMAAEYSLSLAEAELGTYEILSMLGENLAFGDYPTSDAALPEYRQALGERGRLLSVYDRACFVNRYLALMHRGQRYFTEASFFGEPPEGELIGYVKNQYSDEAYDVFSQDFADPRVRYYPGFKECAAALDAGEVDFILLPLEERGGVRLPTVSEIIYRNDYKISAVTPVFGFDLSADIKYALVGRRHRPERHHKGDDRYIELRIPQSGETPLGELLAVSSFFGMSVYRVNTHTFDTEGEESTHFSVVLRSTKPDFSPILTYLTLFAEDFVAVGIYKNLE